MNHNLYPIQFVPIFKEKIWGGRNLERLFHKSLPPEKKIGESWEISDRKEGQSIVKNGDFSGKTIHELMHSLQQELLGDAFTKIPKRFPLLFKMIDAQDNLSLQVHPDDHYAMLFQETDPGKTEMWYVLHAEEGAKIHCGICEGSDPGTFKIALSTKEIFKHIETFLTKTGDTFFLPAGTVHALGKGNVVAEVQVNSDITYRLSDWGRTDEKGQSRPLHIEKGLKVTSFSSKKEDLFLQKRQQGQEIVNCPYFVVREEVLNKTFTISIDRISFEVWTILEGSGFIEKTPFQSGDFFLIPAHIGSVSGTINAPTRILRTLPGEAFKK